VPPPKSERGIEQVWRDLYAKHCCREGFQLTFEEFQFIAQLDCSYCGKKPTKVYQLRFTRKGKFRTDPSVKIRSSGIDRIDSSGDYVRGNVLPCCWPCNRMKSALPLGMFLDLVARIAKRNPSTAEVLNRAATLFEK